MKYREMIHSYIQANKQDIINALKELIQIPSVRGEAEENAPFGQDCAKVLEYAQQLYEKYGFDTELDQKGGYLLSYSGKGEKSLGLFAHADVVPAGEGWFLTPAFEPKEVDGCIIGRGAIDDKSAVVASLYCARIIKELDIPFKSRLVMFTGSNEESGMGDLKNYLQKHTPPDFSLVPDTAFPLYRGNKGRLLLKAKRTLPLGEICSFVGGKAGTNVGDATAKLCFSEAVYMQLKSFRSNTLTIRKKDEYIVISAKGLSKHTALPEGSVNAVALIADALRKCTALSVETQEISEFLFGICSDYYGGYINIDAEDPEFGKLTFVNYLINANEHACELYFNIRFGASVDALQMKSTLCERFAVQGFEVEILDESTPHIVPKDHPMLLSVLDTFQKYTGSSGAEMYVNAGGTYAQLLPCAAEIGTTLDQSRDFDLPDGHGSVHQPDEYINIDGFLSAMELTALMLIEADKVLEK